MRRRSPVLAAMLAALLGLATAGTALADDIQTFLNVTQPICVGHTITVTRVVEVQRSSFGTPYPDGATLTLQLFVAGQPDNATVVISITDPTVVLPSDWTSQADGFVAPDTFTYEATVTATAPGSDSGAMNWFVSANGGPPFGSLSGLTVANTVDCTTVTIDQAAAQADPTDISPILFDVVFSEPVTGFTDADVVLSGTAGATTAIVSGSGATYQVAVSGMTASGTVSASIPQGAALDAGTGTMPNAASTSDDNTVTYEAVPPMVTINQAAAQADPTGTGPILFDVVFSEAVTGFSAADVTLSGTAGATTAVVSGTGPTYQVAVSGMTVSGTVIATIEAGAVLDADSLPNTASGSTDNTVTYVAPVPVPTPTPTPTPTPSPSASPSPSSSPSGAALPDTDTTGGGSSGSSVALLLVAMAGVGLALLVVPRRRRISRS